MEPIGFTLHWSFREGQEKTLEISMTKIGEGRSLNSSFLVSWLDFNEMVVEQRNRCLYKQWRCHAITEQTNQEKTRKKKQNWRHEPPKMTMNQRFSQECISFFLKTYFEEPIFGSPLSKWVVVNAYEMTFLKPTASLHLKMDGWKTSLNSCSQVRTVVFCCSELRTLVSFFPQ